MKKEPDPIDKHVGARVRMLRRKVGMSQTNLGEALDVTFQQVQKYEKGVNRIGASGLRKIARVLEVSPSYFFEGAPKGDLNISDFEESDVVSVARDFLPTGEGLQLNRAFVAIKDPKVRKKILELVSLLDTCEG